MKNSICKLGILSIEDGFIESFDGVFSALFKYQCPNIYDKTEQDHLILVKKIQALLNATPEGIVLQFKKSIRFDKNKILERYKKEDSNPSELLQHLKKETISKYERKQFANEELFLYISYQDKNQSKIIKIEQKIPKNHYFATIFKASDKKKKDAIEAIEDYIDSVLQKMESVGVHFDRIEKDKDIYTHCFESLNPEKSKQFTPQYEPPKKDYLPFSFLKRNPFLKEKTLREKLMLCGFDNQENTLFLDNLYIGSLNLEQLPNITTHDVIKHLFMTHFTSDKLHFDTDICLTIRVPEKQKVLDKLKKKIKRIEQAKNMIAEASVDDHWEDEDAIIASEDITQTKQKLARQTEKPFEISLCAIVKAKSKDDKRKAIKKIEASINSICNMMVIEDDYNHLNNFFSVLPGQYKLNKRTHMVLTNALSYLTPFSDHYRGTDHVQMVFQGKGHHLVSHSLVKNNLPSPHTLLFAGTGGGKSFLTGTYIKNIFLTAKDALITIFEVGKVYRKLVNLFGGQFIAVSMNEKYAINVFPTKKLMNDPKLGADQLTFVKTMICMMITDKKKMPSISSDEKFLIETAIKQLYEGLKEDEKPLLSDFSNILKKNLKEKVYKGDHIDFAELTLNLLAMFCEGQYSVLFNRHSTLHIDKQIVCFDLTDLEAHPEIRHIYFFIINNFIRQRMVGSKKDQYVFFDEVWKLLDDPECYKMIRDLIKTARKYNNYMTLITQDISDVLPKGVADKENTTIPNNCSTKIFLKMDESEYVRLSELGLNKTEIEKCLLLDFKKGKYTECLVKAGEDSFIFKNEPSPFEFEVLETAPTHVAKYNFLDEQDTSNLDLISHIKTEISKG